MRDVVTIDVAQAAGKLRYFTGKPCSKGHVAERYISDRKCMECSRENRKLNHAAEIARNRQWRRDNPIQARGHQIKYRYGITTEQYDAMLLEQCGRCAICGTDTPETRHGQFYVDHCHVSGNVRGLLCRLCNWIIGAAKDNTDTLRKSIVYLQRSRQ